MGRNKKQKKKSSKASHATKAALFGGDYSTCQGTAGSAMNFPKLEFLKASQLLSAK